MNLDQLVASFEATAREARQKAEAIVTNANAEGRTHLTADEDARCESHYTDATRAMAKAAQAKDLAAEEKRQEERLNDIRPTSAKRNLPHYDQVARIGSEPRQYRSPKEVQRNFDGSPIEPTFLQDVYRAQILNDPESMGRLQRHGQEMAVDNAGLVKRAVSTGGVPGFIPPAYLAEDFAAYARAGRPTANLCRSMPLPPEGMTVNIPRVTTPTATGVQAAENTSLANQDPASTLLTANVVSIGGYVQLSRQAVERGMMLDEVVVADLAADYNSRLDAQVLNGTGSSGQHLGILNVSGINAVTFTSASPTVPLLFPKMASALQQVWANRFAGPTCFVTSPREWAWMAAAVDSSNRPLIEPDSNGPNNAFGTLEGANYSGVAGSLFNVPVIMDGNLPDNLGAGTNESRIIAANFSDIYLFEDNGGAPNQIRAEQYSAPQLGILFVCYGYSSLAAGRQPKAISVVSGTGMITPAL